MSSAVTPAEIALLRARYPRAFGAPLWRRLLVTAFGLVAAAYLIWLAIQLGFTPQRLAAGFDKLGIIVARMWPPTPDVFFWPILSAVAETVAMAFLGVSLSILIAAPLGLLGARTVLKNAAAHFFLRRVFDFFRGVPTLIWALIFVRATGLGPMAGVLAIAASDTAALAKLAAEAIENTDAKPVEGLIVAGASPIVTARLGVLTQALPVMVSQALYAFESNIRSAAILGVVGAGGIGFELQARIRIGAWDQVAFIILTFLVVVALLDWLSQRLRERLTRGPRAAKEISA